uniref:Tail assembly chaperone n=1 Tax=Streptomyces phage Geonosis TaxID=3158856 RepID=A0AAU7GX35_9CAUD
MGHFVHIEPADAQRRAFARWALSQTPKLQTSSSTGTDVPLDLYPDVPPELLEGAYVDGFRYGGPEAPQPAAVAAPEDLTGPKVPNPQSGSQAATSGPAKKPRKRAPRRPRKVAGSKLTAEAMAAETVANVAAASPDSGGQDSAGE